MEKKTNKKIIKIGSYSIGLTAIVIAVIIAFNLLCGQLPTKFSKFDMTPDAVLTFGDTTKSLIAGIEEDVTLYHIVQSGYEDAYIVELLNRYEAESDKITLKVIDPLTNPTFLTKYTSTGATQNTVVIESAKRHYVIDGSKFYMYEPVGYEGQYLTASEYEYYKKMYTQSGYEFSAIEYFFGEKEITGALDFVTSDTIPVVYSLTGHGETALGTVCAQYATDENVEIKDLTLIAGETASVPADAEAVFINIAQKDITENEYNALVKYLDEGGNIILTTDLSYHTAENTPNIVKLAAYMGLECGNAPIIEGDANHYTYQPFYLIPDIQAAGIMTEISQLKYMIGAFFAHPLYTTGAENRSVSALLKTSSSSYLFTEEDPDGANAKKESYTVAYQSTITNPESGETAGTLIWFASPYFFSDDLVNFGVANPLLFSHILGEFCEKTTSINLIGKELTSAVLTVTESDNMVWTTVYVILIPLAALVTGFVLWFSRRRK